MSLDYRNTQYCPTLDGIDQRKDDLKKEILAMHPKAINFYNYVRKEFKEAFLRAYNYKCSYCGNSIENICIALFEVDHFIHESSFGTSAEAGTIDNVVIACYDCNRNKHAFPIQDSHAYLLHPDKSNIATVFCRDEVYYIKITEAYASNAGIVSFYEKMKFAHETRRLDYLLLQMRGLCESIKKSPIHAQMESAVNKLQSKRNRMQCK